LWVANVEVDAKGPIGESQVHSSKCVATALIHAWSIKKFAVRGELIEASRSEPSKE
jgi:hypothetical protein